MSNILALLWTTTDGKHLWKLVSERSLSAGSP